MIRRALALALTVLAAAAVHAQDPSGLVRGRVVTVDTGEPIRNARVGTADGPEAPAALTDADGRFVLTGVPADQKDLLVARTGYANAKAPVSADMEIRLAKGGVITGRVLDDFGDPLPLINIVAQRITRARGGVSFERVMAVETDDLGDYRLFGLAGGEYVVAAAPGRLGVGTTTIPVPIDRAVFRNYYPHAETPEKAQPIAVRPGEEVPGIDLTVPLPPFGPQPPPGSPPGTAPPPPPRGSGTAAIRGHVIGANGLPIRRARVQLLSAEQRFTPSATPTDDEGRYEFPGLRPGSYFVSAGTLAGRQEPFVGAGGSGPERITVTAGAIVDHIDITLPRAAVISGRVVDEYGDPIADANVRVEVIMFSRGRRRLVSAPAMTSRQTDDRGRYRIFGLPRGHFIVDAVVGEAVPGSQTADWPGYARTYFPGTPVPGEAQPVDIAEGQQALTVDFSLVRGRIAGVSGTASLADGTPLQGVMALSPSVRSGAIATPPLSVRTGEDGSFVFTRVPPGEYVMQAATSRSTVSTEGEFATQFISVNGVDATGIAVRLSAGSTIEGRVIFEGADPPADPDMHLSPVPADPDMASLVDNEPARAEIHDDLTFEISGINGPRRLLLTQAPDGWRLKAVLVNGVDMTDVPLMFGAPEQSLRDVEVVLTNKLTEVLVSAGDAKARAAGDFRVTAFPADSARRYAGSRFVAIGVPEANGLVTLRGLPPGEYYVCALSQRVMQETPASDDGEFMESLVAGASRITLTEGERRSVSVGVIVR